MLRRGSEMNQAAAKIGIAWTDVFAGQGARLGLDRKQALGWWGLATVKAKHPEISSLKGSPLRKGTNMAEILHGSLRRTAPESGIHVQRQCSKIKQRFLLLCFAWIFWPLWFQGPSLLRLLIQEVAPKPDNRLFTALPHQQSHFASPRFLSRGFNWHLPTWWWKHLQI